MAEPPNPLPSDLQDRAKRLADDERRWRSPRRLSVEGNDDKYAITSLIGHHPKTRPNVDDWFPYIEPPYGDTGVLDKIDKATFKSFKVVGFVVDANGDAEVRWRELQQKFAEAEVMMLDIPAPNGLIGEYIDSESKHKCRCGAWMMPNNESKGMLEDFLARLIPPDDRVWKHAQKATKEAKELGAPFSEERHLRKAEIRAWLAWQETPGLSIGNAIASKVLDSTDSIAEKFVDWFRLLFCETQ